MAPRDLDDDDTLTTGAAEPEAVGSRLADDAIYTEVYEETLAASNGVAFAARADGAQLHTHATVDNRVEEVDVVLVGEADDVIAALDALSTAIEAGDTAAADDPAAVLRAAFHDRAAAAAASHADYEPDLGSDGTGYSGDVDQDRDASQDMTADQGLAT